MSPKPGSRIFSLSECGSVSDHLIFTDSELGHSYYLDPRPETTALNQIEPDVFFRGRTFMGLGRRLIFQVVNPTVGSRLAVEITASIKGDGENLLPPAVVIGADRRPMPFIGRGSARVFSDPIAPIVAEDRAFIALDMGVDGQPFPDQRAGLMTLYGTHIPLDRRLLTGHARDISLISARELDQLAAPVSIQRFSDDLANPALEYSGIYEDGWISEAAYFGLSQPDNDAQVVVRGAVPLIDDPNFSTELRVLVDGEEVSRSRVRPVRSKPEGLHHRARDDGALSYASRSSSVSPGKDQRPAAASISFIGFDATAAGAPPSVVRNVPAELESSALQSTGLAQDGWLGGTASLRLTQPGTSADLVLRGQVPQVDNPAFSTDLALLVDGREVGRKTLGPGDFELRAAVPPAAGPRRVELRFSATQQLPAQDGRQVGALIQSIGFEVPAVAPAASSCAAGPGRGAGAGRRDGRPDTVRAGATPGGHRPPYRSRQPGAAGDRTGRRWLARRHVGVHTRPTRPIRDAGRARDGAARRRPRVHHRASAARRWAGGRAADIGPGRFRAAGADPGRRGRPAPRRAALLGHPAAPGPGHAPGRRAGLVHRLRGQLSLGASLITAGPAARRSIWGTSVSRSRVLSGSLSPGAEP